MHAVVCVHLLRKLAECIVISGYWIGHTQQMSALAGIQISNTSTTA